VEMSLTIQLIRSFVLNAVYENDKQFYIGMHDSTVSTVPYIVSRSLPFALSAACFSEKVLLRCQMS
jgi:hypothetical protein